MQRHSGAPWGAGQRRESRRRVTSNPLGSNSEYHVLSGPGPHSAGGTAIIEFTAQLAYDTPYALRFYADLETHAEAVPELPSALLLLVGLVGLRRR